jgi:hypothetical protein
MIQRKHLNQRIKQVEREKNMSNFEKEKAKKLTIRDVANQKLDGTVLKEFDEFLEFLKSEKISTPWKSINGFKMNYKGKIVGAISMNYSEKNYIDISVATTGEWSGYDDYLEGLSDELTNLFMAQISIKCIHCRPTCGCSSHTWNYDVMGKKITDGCRNAGWYSFDNNSGNLSTMMLLTSRAELTRIPIRQIPLETVKSLILTRKAYITKIPRGK